jgi:adenylate kinase
MLENAAAVLEEYRSQRNLTPLRIVIHGPPFSGKSTYARLLCQHYGLHHIEPHLVIQETIAALVYKHTLRQPNDARNKK